MKIARNGPANRADTPTGYPRTRHLRRAQWRACFARLRQGSQFALKTRRGVVAPNPHFRPLPPTEGAGCPHRRGAHSKSREKVPPIAPKPLLATHVPDTIAGRSGGLVLPDCGALLKSPFSLPCRFQPKTGVSAPLRAHRYLRPECLMTRLPGGRRQLSRAVACDASPNFPGACPTPPRAFRAACGCFIRETANDRRKDPWTTFEGGSDGHRKTALA